MLPSQRRNNTRKVISSNWGLTKAQQKVRRDLRDRQQKLPIMCNGAACPIGWDLSLLSKVTGNNIEIVSTNREVTRSNEDWLHTVAISWSSQFRCIHMAEFPVFYPHCKRLSIMGFKKRFTRTHCFHSWVVLLFSSYYRVRRPRAWPGKWPYRTLW